MSLVFTCWPVRVRFKVFISDYITTVWMPGPVHLTKTPKWIHNFPYSYFYCAILLESIKPERINTTTASATNVFNSWCWMKKNKNKNQSIRHTYTHVNIIVYTTHYWRHWMRSRLNCLQMFGLSLFLLLSCSPALPINRKKNLFKTPNQLAK